MQTRLALSLTLFAALAACGGGGSQTSRAPSGNANTALVDPAALYCAGRGGEVIQRVSQGRRADLCRLPGGRTVSTADLINSNNDL
ncbi:MAG: DUF333 domain-containing protein [Paracoccus sp. (in: a-proteobacteria)]|uniref:DUF333 domain-containing protein n=1 Tax=Paracoccus sp. TaxID=267 RepID=UPI0026DF78A0|nr:DUF333 domain-containing protein [Paracoccus sp. (in: a-proteobacteria)]MDO5620797.1 DUF333 domain-containing protein [Paracoccus sp. (in: a-proteobacteria)]